MFAHNNLAVVLVVITLGSNQLCIASLRNTTTNPNFPEFTWSNAGDNAQLIGDVAAAANFQTIENNKVETNLETNNTETTPPEPQNDPQTEELETLQEQTQHQETQHQETQQQETQQESQPPQSTSQTTTQQQETKPKETQQKSQQPQPTSQTISGNANKKIVSDVANAAASKTAPTTSSDEKFSMTAMIIGLSVGSVVLALTAIVLFLCRNKTTNNKKKRLPTVASEIMVFPPELPKDPLQIVIEYSDNRKDPLSTTCTDVPDPQDLAGTMSALTEPYYKMGVTADSQNLSRAPALSKACSDITEEPSLYMVTENNIDEI